MKIKNIENVNTIGSALVAFVTIVQWLLKFSVTIIVISATSIILAWIIALIIILIRRPWHSKYRPGIMRRRGSQYSFRVFYNTLFKGKIYESEYQVPMTNELSIEEAMIDQDLLGKKITVIIEDDPVGYICQRGNLPAFIVNEDTSSDILFDLLYQYKESIYETNIFFLTTPSRRLTEKSSFTMNREIGSALKKFQIQSKKELRIISKIDSCLRSNYYAEYAGLMDGFGRFTCEILMPSYIEQGRITVHGNQYIKENNNITPLHKSEYSSFTGLEFNNSNLALWLLKKNKHIKSRHNIGLISIDDLRSQEIKTLVRKIEKRPKRIESIVIDSSENEDLSKALQILIEFEEKKTDRVFFKMGPSMINRIVSEFVKKKPENTLSNINPNDKAIIVAGSLSSVTKRQIANFKDEPNTSLITLTNNEIESQNILKIINRKRNKILEYNSRGDNVILTTEFWREASNEYPNIEKRDKVLNLLSEICRLTNDDVKKRWIVIKGSDTALFTLNHGFGLKEFFYCGHILPGVIHVKVKINDDSKSMKSCFIIGGNVGNDDILINLIAKVNGNQ